MRSPAEGSFGPRTPGGADLAPPDAGGQLPELFWRLTTRLGCMILPVTTASHHLKSGKRLPQCRTEPPLTAAAKPPAAPSRSTCERPGSRHPQRQYWCGIASAAPTAGLLPARSRLQRNRMLGMRRRRRFQLAQAPGAGRSCSNSPRTPTFPCFVALLLRPSQRAQALSHGALPQTAACCGQAAPARGLHHC